MDKISKKPQSLPGDVQYKLLTAFCLMSLLPILMGAYVASVLLKYPFYVNPASLMTINAVALFSLFFSFLGYQVTKQTIITLLNNQNKKGN
ncbi:MAG: hypothetical protein HY593_04250 [Candidatus Omnitrophica bacterium]|nr:hypothetical protein [Candidatus Omnitrophota bacterium]